MKSIQQWEHEAHTSLERAQARRFSPHPIPHGSQWRTALGLIALALLVLVVLVCLKAIL